jgi:hypothetical protein
LNKRALTVAGASIVLLTIASVALARPSPLRWSAHDVRVTDPAAAYGGAPQGYREPVVAISPRDPDLMLAAIIDQNPRNRIPDNGGWEGWNHIYRSANGGRTWQSIRIIHRPDERRDAGDPSILFDKKGNAYVVSLSDDITQNHRRLIEVHRSTDGGRHWSGPAYAFKYTFDPAHEHCVSADKELAAADERTGDLVLTFTRTTWRCGDMADDILTEDVGGVPPDADIEVVLTRSRDGGRTWTKPVNLWHGYALGAKPVIAPDGTTYVAFAASDFTGRTLACPSALGTVANVRPSEIEMVVASSKDGKHWRYERRPTCEGDVLASQRASALGDADPTGGALMPSITVDRSNGRVYAAWPTFAPTPPFATFGIELMSTANHGRSWTATRHMTPPDQDSMLPAVAADGGAVSLAWVGSDDGWGSYRAYHVTSYDGGRTWTKQRVLGSRAATGNGEIGDYIWADANRGRVVVIWTENRSGKATDVFVRTARR